MDDIQSPTSRAAVAAGPLLRHHLVARLGLSDVSVFLVRSGATCWDLHMRACFRPSSRYSREGSAARFNARGGIILDHRLCFLPVPKHRTDLHSLHQNIHREIVMSREKTDINWNAFVRETVDEDGRTLE